MSDASPPTLLGQAILDAIRQAVRDAMREVLREELQANGHSDNVELLNPKQLAVALNVKKSWVYDRTRRKRDPIPHVKVGRYPRFELNKVLAWLDSKRYA